MTPNRTISPMGQVTVQSPSSCLDDFNKHNNEANKCESSLLSGCYIKKSKRDPIVEYDTELAESIEYELGLKKQNGPRYNLPFRKQLSVFTFLLPRLLPFCFVFVLFFSFIVVIAVVVLGRTLGATSPMPSWSHVPLRAVPSNVSRFRRSTNGSFGTFLTSKRNTTGQAVLAGR